MPIMSPELTREAYCELVSGFYGFIAPAEESLLRSGAWEQTQINFSGREKTPILVKDLENLGQPIPKAIPEDAAMNLSSPAKALGYLYVMEGSTLGGQFISRHLKKHLNLHAENGAAYFNGYGPETAVRWKEFCEALIASAASLNQDDAIVESARATFESLQQWLFPNPEAQPANR